MAKLSLNHAKKELGQKLREVREARGLSQEALAEKSNISRTHISYIEIGATAPSLKFLIALAEALEIDVRDLIPF